MRCEVAAAVLTPKTATETTLVTTATGARTFSMASIAPGMERKFFRSCVTGFGKKPIFTYPSCVGGSSPTSNSSGSKFSSGNSVDVPSETSSPVICGPTRQSDEDVTTPALITRVSCGPTSPNATVKVFEPASQLPLAEATPTVQLGKANMAEALFATSASGLVMLNCKPN